MKAIIEFSLPDEKYELDAAIKSMELVSALHQVDDSLRLCLKHGGDPVQAMQACRETIRDAISAFQ